LIEDMVDYASPAAFEFDVAVINVVDRAVVALVVVYVMLGQPRLVREIVDDLSVRQLNSS
jgi:hypothetical protein